MEDFWNRTKTFAEEAAKKSQTLTTSSSKRIADPVSETAKKSKELATEASKKADKPMFRSSSAIAAAAPSPAAIEKFGVTDDLRSFVKGLTSTTFLT